MTEKTLMAVIGGHTCLDIRHPDFERQQSLAQRLQPGLTYDPHVTLKEILCPLPPDLVSEMQKFISGSVLSTGGGVSNTGIPLAYLLGSGNVRLMAKVGQDPDPIAEAIAAIYSEHAPGSTSLIRVPEQTSSYTIVMNDGSGHCMYAHAPGTNNTFTPKDIDMAVATSARVFEFSYPTLMEQFYKNTDNLAEMCREISQSGTKVWIDMHDLHEDTPSGEANWDEILSKALPYVFAFCPSIDEALFIHDRELLTQYKSQVQEGKTIMDFMEPDVLKKTAAYYLDMGAKVVVLKCGDAGLYIAAGKNDEPGWNNLSVLVPAYSTSRLLDTTGAGDNSIAGMIAAYLLGFGPINSLRIGNAAGYLNVQHQGSIGAFKSMDDLYRVALITTARSIHQKLEAGFSEERPALSIPGGIVRSPVYVAKD